ncbi:ras-related protein Rab-24-like isoform X2 [Athalia rosae]|uniref:ras-related protein Rab-24-like isoform X2 n=1 Tax=Athalia rosae TaxID=37344 RepID=UPI002033ECBE|nr:ras-related protein Rab-24-like isoform X2 [Athalia rosae]
MRTLILIHTIGAAFAAKEVCVGDAKFVLGVWDTAGSERYEAMSKIYYRGAKAAIVCYDATNINSWNRARFWVRELRSVEEECIVYICGTKKDLIDGGEAANPDIDIVEKYANGIQSKFYLTSSKNGENVAELFHEISKDYISNPNNLRSLEETISLTKEAKESHCCPLG